MIPPATVLSDETLPIENEDDIVLVRKRVRERAEQLGFDPFAAGAVITAASELARNIWRHAKHGKATISVVQERNRTGLRLDFVDDGPGIPDIERVLRGGQSTVRSLGLGLIGSKRLSDAFAIESTVGVGTKVSFLKWKRR